MILVGGDVRGVLFAQVANQLAVEAVFLLLGPPVAHLFFHFFVGLWRGGGFMQHLEQGEAALAVIGCRDFNGAGQHPYFRFEGCGQQLAESHPLKGVDVEGICGVALANAVLRCQLAHVGTGPDLCGEVLGFCVRGYENFSHI